MIDLADIRAALDSLRELTERAGDAGVDAEFTEQTASAVTCLLLELMEHRRNGFDPRRARSIATAQRMLAARERMRRANLSRREINAALQAQFGYHRSHRHALLKLAESSAVLAGRLSIRIQEPPKEKP